MESLPPLDLTPPQWSLDVGYMGRAFVWLAILLFFGSAIGWLLTPRYPALKKWGARAFTFGSVSLFGAFLSLAVLFVANRLEFNYVFEHGDGSNTIPYRIAGIWAGQQGSFLLWACCSALFGLLAVRGTGELRRWFTIPYAGFLGAIASILAYETPFGLNLFNGKPFVPSSGIGLTPALQNYWVTIHPPTIFMGFGALTVLAAYSFSAMATNKLQEWVPLVRPWALVAMTLVGVGLCMGGFWAYETLGWGGFWMWDPVENVSFVPWVASAALIHGLMVQIARKRWTISNLLLGGLPFLLFVYGTFLTRSGVLNATSVHSFANMDNSALKLLLGFFAISSLTFLSLWVWRAMQFRKVGLQPDEPPKGIHRESLFRFGNLLLLTLGLGAALGMSWPMFMAIAGKAPKVVEEALYHKTLIYAYIPLMLAMALGPLAAWRGMGMREFWNRIFGVLCVTVFFVGVTMYIIGHTPIIRELSQGNDILMPFGYKVNVMPWVLFLLGLSIAVAVANGWRIAELIRRSKMSAVAFLAHIGVAVLMSGLIISRGFEEKVSLQVPQGGRSQGLGYEISYKGMTTNDLRDRNNEVLFEMKKGNEKWIATPGLYYTDPGDGQLQAMVWPHIERHPFYDVYMAIQGPVTDTGSSVSLKPGETKKLNGVDVKFVKRTLEGTPGKDGAKWGAQLVVGNSGDTIDVNPQMELAGGSTVDHPAQVSPDYAVYLQKIDAATGGVTIGLEYVVPQFPIDLFYKPMTILVWLGTGILAVAGLLSAWYRRPPRKALAATEPKPETEKKAAPQKKPAVTRA